MWHDARLKSRNSGAESTRAECLCRPGLVVARGAALIVGRVWCQAHRCRLRRLTEHGVVRVTRAAPPWARSDRTAASPAWDTGPRGSHHQGGAIAGLVPSAPRLSPAWNGERVARVIWTELPRARWLARCCCSRLGRRAACRASPKPSPGRPNAVRNASWRGTALNA